MAERATKTVEEAPPTLTEVGRHFRSGRAVIDWSRELITDPKKLSRSAKEALPFE